MLDTVTTRSKEDLLRARDKHLGKNLSISYKDPLKIVRGKGQYLYDETGNAFLDCVNNVCHVGHCHPKVVTAGQAQMEILNTNTRYLHDNIINYAEWLTSTFPDPLNVCFFVNSGSEANDLALRLARTHTGQQDTIVIDHAYHGHTQSLIDISPYKHDARGGQGAPPTTHKVRMPDSYRGDYKTENAGALYARDIAGVIENLKGQGKGVAGFIGESALGCGGQIFLPEGYFETVYAHVRAAGGVCIADEVQVGFGRVGTHMWAFEMQGVVPDIVTLGKPMGNGHPLAAVITTPEIAASFANGMEYFNTFGGNPVSCAIGLAVLEVIQEEGLQKHALEVGSYFLEGLRQLQEKHALIGDVRGSGLFIGIELVKDRGTLEPATAEANQIIQEMRQRHILLSTDGPYENVIKIKPPLVFSKENAAQVISNLAKVLSDLMKM